MSCGVQRYKMEINSCMVVPILQCLLERFLTDQAHVHWTNIHGCRNGLHHVQPGATTCRTCIRMQQAAPLTGMSCAGVGQAEVHPRLSGNHTVLCHHIQHGLLNHAHDHRRMCGKGSLCWTHMLALAASWWLLHGVAHSQWEGTSTYASSSA